MRIRAATIGLALACLARAAFAGEAGVYTWPPSLAVEMDLDRSGTSDSARLGVADKSVRLLLTIDSKPLPAIDIPIDGSKEFGICPGSEPSMSVIPQSEAPLNALGESPHGYEICPDCTEIVVGGGECDPLHFYWDTVADKLAWWRA